MLFRQPSPNDRHYHVIDIARALAAISILFWHYQHLVTGGSAYSPARQTFPLYNIMWPLYEGGGVAVQFFWIVSGFVFAAVYCGRTPTAAAFAKSRIARLYPLHIVTLLVVAALQLISLETIGRYLIYTTNDAYHFFLNVFFVSGWGFEHDKSFNGPIWSVSVEIIVYALFIIALPRLFRWGIIGPAMLSAIFLIAFRMRPDNALFNCGIDFFAGCSIYVASMHLRPVWALICAIAGSMAATLLWLIMHQQGIATLVAFCSVVLLTALAENTVIARWAAKLRWFGDCTYGLYLWHIPVQIAVLLIVIHLGVSTSIFLSPIALITFVLGMILIARISYLLVEAPARRAIQNWGRVPKVMDAPISAP